MTEQSAQKKLDELKEWAKAKQHFTQQSKIGDVPSGVLECLNVQENLLKDILQKLTTKKKQKLYINRYDEAFHIFQSKKQADHDASEDRLQCHEVEIEWDE